MYEKNMSAGAIQDQYNESKKPVYEEKPAEQKMTDEERMKKYLNVRLADDETSRNMFIRLLPVTRDAQTPFALVYAHKVKVSKEVSASGFKTILCPVKNHHVEGIDNCPFCTIAAEAAAGKKGLNRKSKEYEDLNSIEYANSAKPMWVCRCIVRGKEDEGPKWWMFSHQEKKCDGFYDKIMSIDSAKRLLRKDDTYTIFDLNCGRDLLLTITKQKDTDGKWKQKIDIQACDNDSSLTDNIEQGLQWINGEDDWHERYKFKNYDYMSVLAEGGVPVYDREQRAYVNGLSKPEEKSAEPAQEEPKVYAYIPQAQQPASPVQPVAAQTAVAESEISDLPF